MFSTTRKAAAPSEEADCRRRTKSRGDRQMNQAIDRPHQGLDALRIQAEIETADRAQNKRPTWAPAVVLDGELLELCYELEYLAPDDKPVARLWATFADLGVKAPSSAPA